MVDGEMCLLHAACASMSGVCLSSCSDIVIIVGSLPCISVKIVGSLPCFCVHSHSKQVTEQNQKLCIDQSNC